MKCLISLIFFVFSSAVFAEKTLPELDPNKFTICAITINSNNERNVFEKQAKKYHQSFNPIVELTDLGEDDWFEKACRSGVRCDQLIISGHFGGGFFGSSEKRLSLSTLESKGCNKSCEGILGQPYEVFLFGCNTLATKGGDSRTPEQYLQVLLNDGISRADAERILESRYGATGDSIVSTMKRAFEGERKKLYGFHSIGPSGKNVQSLLEGYFGKSNLREHLNRLRAERATNKVASINRINKELAEALRRTYFAQCATGGTEQNKTDKVTEIICGLQDKSLGTDLKAMFVMEAFAQENYRLFIPAIDEFLTQHPEALEIEEIKNLSKNESLKNQFLGLIAKSNFLLTAVAQISLAQKLGFIAPEEENKHLSALVNELLKSPLSISDKDALCSLPRKAVQKITLDESELLVKKFKKEDYLALKCLAERVKTKEAHFKLSEGLNDSSSEVRRAVVFALGTRKTQDREVQLRLIKMLYDTDWNVRFEAGFILGDIKPQDREVQLKLTKGFKVSWTPETEDFLKEGKVQERGSQLKFAEVLKDPRPAVRLAAAHVFEEIKPEDRKVQLMLAEGLKDSNSEVRLAVADAFKEIKSQDIEVQMKLAEGLNDIDLKVRLAVADALRESKPLHEEVQKMLGKDLK